MIIFPIGGRILQNLKARVTRGVTVASPFWSQIDDVIMIHDIGVMV